VPANANRAKVVSISLGGSGACDSTTQGAINSARSRGASVIVAAGNSNANASNFSPANCSGVVTVAAVGRNGGKASYSNFGATVEIAAPGGSGGVNSVLSTLNAGQMGPGADSYALYNGTVDGHAARQWCRRTDAFGEAHADTRPGDLHPAEHGPRLPGDLLAVRLGHRERPRRGGCGHRWNHATAGRQTKSSLTTRPRRPS
jgi:subtilisin family serine protease